MIAFERQVDLAHRILARNIPQYMTMDGQKKVKVILVSLKSFWPIHIPAVCLIPRWTIPDGFEPSPVAIANLEPKRSDFP